MSESAQRRARRVSLWLLYALDIAGGRPEDALQAARETATELEEDADIPWDRVQAMVVGTHGRLEELTAVVQAVSPRWKVDRMAPIDRNILRLGAWEILHGGHPPLAVINGCVDLAKDYGDKGTPAFVNGLLDQICRNNEIAIR